jgi:hypothetical protein
MLGDVCHPVAVAVGNQQRVKAAIAAQSAESGQEQPQPHQGMHVT